MDGKKNENPTATIAMKYNIDDILGILEYYGKVDFFNRRDPTRLISVYFDELGQLIVVDFDEEMQETRERELAHTTVGEILTKGSFVPVDVPLAEKTIIKQLMS